MPGKFEIISKISFFETNKNISIFAKISFGFSKTKFILLNSSPVLAAAFSPEAARIALRTSEDGVELWTVKELLAGGTWQRFKLGVDSFARTVVSYTVLRHGGNKESQPKIRWTAETGRSPECI